MKTGILFLFSIFLLFQFENADANYYSKAVSENDTILIIVQKRITNNCETSPIIFPSKLNTALPDTTRDIIIIYRRSLCVDFNDIHPTVEITKYIGHINYALSKPAFRNIFICQKSLL